MSIRCYVIDDETDAIKLLKRYIERTPGLELVGSSRDPLVALSELTGGIEADLTFIDVDMRQLSGLELAGMVSSYTSVVFTTAHPQYAIQAFQKEAWDYLLKPIGYEDFLWSIQRVKKRMVQVRNGQGLTEPFFNVKSELKGRMIRIKHTDVTHIEGAQNYVYIFTAGNERHITYLPMKAVENSLPGDLFVRVHRSFIVNINYVRVIERSRLLLENGKELVLGDHYKQKFLKMMDGHLLNPGKAS